MEQQANEPWAFAYLGRSSRIPHDLAQASLLITALASEVQDKEKNTSCWKCGTSLRMMNLHVGLCNRCCMIMWDTTPSPQRPMIIGNSLSRWFSDMQQSEQLRASAKAVIDAAEARQRGRFVEWLDEQVFDMGNVTISEPELDGGDS